MKRTFKISIRLKTGLMMVFLALMITIVAMGYFSMVTSDRNIAHYKSVANNISATIAATVNVDDFNEIKDEVSHIYDTSSTHPDSDADEQVLEEYISQYEHIPSMPAFNRIRDFLRKIVELNKSFEVDCAYVCYVNPENKQMIYLVDSADGEDACPPGWIDPVFEMNQAVLTDPSVGFPAYLVDYANYGYLVSAGYPIYSGDKVVGFANVDILMKDIRDQQRNSIMILFAWLISTTIGMSIIFLVIEQFILVGPIKKLVSLANAYDSNNIEKTHQIFKEFHLKTRDEIEDLSLAMKNMESDVYNNIQSLRKTNSDLLIAQEETKKMTQLANTDALTNVRSKIAYNQVVEKVNRLIKNKENKPFGIVMVDLNDLKVVNDKFGHDMGDQVLIQLTKMIQSVFVTSNTYRIGGDEFVVIVIDEEYEKIADLVNLFKEKVNECIVNDNIELPYKISAAIGYSCFDEKMDKTIDDVFKRADRIMYVNKHVMKAKEE